MSIRAAQVYARTQTRNQARAHARTMQISGPGVLWLGSILCIAVFISTPAAALAPGQDWRSIASQHCDVHFPQRLEALARRSASLCDEAHERVTKFLQAQPRDRVQLVVEDEGDSANGWALTVPYNTIHIYAVAPAELSSLGDSDDWLRMLIFHEYTHIVHMDTVGGVNRIVQQIIGKQWSPNQLQPLWFIEGLAVLVESDMTSGGRVRSNLQKMILRSAALDHKLWSLERLSSDRLHYPHGQAVYVYGGQFMHYLQQRFGEQIFAHISHRYGRQILPYGMNRAAKASLQGHSYDTLYQDFLDDIRHQADSTVARLQILGKDHSQQITPVSENLRQARIDKQGRIIFFANPVDDSPGLYRLDPKQGQVHRLFETQGFAGMDLLPNGDIILAQGEVFSNHYNFYDLYRVTPDVTPDKGQSTRLTYGLRAREPSVSPDGQQVLFVRRDGASSSLSLLNLNSKKIRDLRRFDDGSQFYSPQFHPHAQRALVSLWRPGGQRDLWEINLHNHKLKQLTSDRAMDLQGRYSSDGKSLLFSSDIDGVFHIYQLNLDDNSVSQITNKVTGAFDPILSDDGKQLIFTGYTSSGYALFSLSRDKFLNMPASYSYGRPWPRTAPPASQAKATKYSVWPSLRPWTWTPMLNSDTDGLPIMGIKLNGQDAVGLQRWRAQVLWQSPSPHVEAQVSYAYNNLATPLQVYLSRVDHLATMTVAPQQPQQNLLRRGFDGELNARWSLQRWYHSLSFSVGYGLNWREPLGAQLQPDQRAASLPWQGRSSFLRLSAQYHDLRRFSRSVSNERGRYIRTSLRLAQPWLASQNSFVELSGEARTFMQIPHLPNHVLAIKLSAGQAWGPRSQRRLFVLGGLPWRSPVDDLLFGFPASAASLRGYKPSAFVGDGALNLNLEYRLPLWQQGLGLSTLPLFVEQLDAALFCDLGGTYWNRPRAEDFLHAGIGAELRVRLVFSYLLPIELRAGLAHAVDAEGEMLQPYISMGASY